MRYNFQKASLVCYLFLLGFTSLSGTGSPLPQSRDDIPDAELEFRISACRLKENLLPKTCKPGLDLTEKNGGVVNLPVNVQCAKTITTLHCTWVCAQGNQRRPAWFAYQHGV